MKNLITYLKTLWSWSRTDRVRTLAIDAVSLPSFCRVNMLKLVSILVLVLTVGVGNVWGAEEVVYTLEPAAGSNNSYTENCDVEIDGITWNVTGNSTLTPWRLGGKSLTETDRTVYSKTAISSAITKVELTVGGASSITVNSLKLIVASDANFTNTIDEVSKIFSANSTLTFTPTSPKTEWETDAYYKFVFNVTVSGSSNKFVEFTEAKFYAEPAASCDNKVNISKGTESHGTFTLDKTGEQNACDALSVTVTPSPAEHFHVASVSATDPETTGTAGAAVDNGDGTWTITYSANAKGASTVNVTFEEDTKHTLTFYNNGIPTGETLEIYDGMSFWDMYDEDNTLEWPILTSSSACHATSRSFAGWTSENIGSTSLHTIDIDLVVDPSTIIEDDLDLNALWGTIPASPTTTFAASGYSESETAPLTKTQDNISLYLEAGSIYIGSPNTFTITSGTSHYFSVTASNKVLAKLETKCNSGTYCISAVSDGNLSSSSTANQTTTNINTYSVWCWAKTSNQIRMQTCAVYCYDNYITSCQACVAPDHVDISGRWDRFGGETISLTAAAYASAGTSNPIADGNIRGWQWEKLVGSTWTPLSNGTAAGVTISGATTKNLQIANCNGDNSGKYRCVVSTGATCSTASNGFQVKVYVLECYTGGTTTYNFTRIDDTQAGTCQINLAAGNHAFKFHADQDYYGNNGTINEDVSNWVCSTSQGNLTIAAGLGGTFTINMEYSTSGSSSVLGEPEISVTYPRKTIYLTPGVWNTGGAKFAIYYFRKVGETIYGEGFTDFITADDCGSYAEIPQWNGVKINAVRLNSNTTASDLTNSANHYEAAWDKKWNQTSDITVTSNNSISITGWGPQNGDSPYDYGTYSTPTYTISYAAGTGGSGTRESETKTCGVDFVLPNSAVFTRTGYTQTGWATEDGGSNAYDLGGSYTTNAAQTFYPFWTEATYSVTLTTNGGTINAGNVTSYVYGTGATLPTNVTKDHATFQGWYASSTFDGERVYSIGASEFGDKTYWAKWEAITYTVTWKANGSIVRTDSNVAEGGKVASVPSAPADLTTDPNGCDAEFAGWVIEANDPGALSISSQTSAPVGLFTDVTGSPTITGNVTFVAIYRQEQ